MARPIHLANLVAQAIKEGPCSTAAGVRYVGVSDPVLWSEIRSRLGFIPVPLTVPNIGAKMVITYISDNAGLFQLYNIEEVINPADTAWEEKRAAGGVERHATL